MEDVRAELIERISFRFSMSEFTDSRFNLKKNGELTSKDIFSEKTLFYI